MANLRSWTLTDVAQRVFVDRLDLNPSAVAVPSELPWDASQEFSQMLIDYVPIIAKADFGQPFEKLSLPDEIKRAMVLHRGKLTKDYEYMKEFVKD